VAVSLQVLDKQPLRSLDRNRDPFAVLREFPNDFTQSRHVVGDLQLHLLAAAIVHDAELVLVSAPATPAKAGRCKTCSMRSPISGRAVSVVDPPNAHPGARGATPTGRSKIRHRREGRVCRWTSQVTLPRSSSRRRR
jgi:hypothetical protein